MGWQARILVIEDDLVFADLEARALRRQGYAVSVATSGAEALELLRSEPPDLALLDYELPDMDGFELLDALKAGAEIPPMPVLFLTAESSTDHQVYGLDSGATDYIPKDGDMHVVLAKVRAALRRTHLSGRRLRQGQLLVDPIEGTVLLGELAIHLDRRPLMVLHRLMSTPGATVTRETLLRDVWSSEYRGYDRALEQAIYVIRKTLGPDWIVTVPTVGYRFQLPGRRP